MLNKKKVIIVVVAIILVFAIISAIFINSNKSQNVSKIYHKLSESNEYLFEMKDESNYKISIAKKDGQTCIDMDSENERVTTLVKNNATYVISHSQKEYRVYNADVAGETVVTDMLGDLKEKEFSTGKEKINGKNYKYVEYTGFAGFMTSTSLELDESKAKTRFYFEGNNLVYIKTIPDNEEEELLEVKISYSVPDELFEIPSDYAEKDDSSN